MYIRMYVLYSVSSGTCPVYALAWKCLEALCCPLHGEVVKTVTEVRINGIFMYMCMCTNDIIAVADFGIW